MICRIIFVLWAISVGAFGQARVHTNAHAHNDYEHSHPLFDALENGFNSVEADVHLLSGKLLVGHNGVSVKSPSLERLYLAPLDSLLKRNGGSVYKSNSTLFYLMVDIKTDAERTYRSLQTAMANFSALKCSTGRCPVKIFLSGNRPTEIILKEGYSGFALDGRPEDLGKGISTELMPVISDTYLNWSTWSGKSPAQKEDLLRVRELAKRVHAEGKLFRLWGIPDNELGWEALLDAGVDLINTDKLTELNKFLNTIAK